MSSPHVKRSNDKLGLLIASICAALACAAAAEAGVVGTWTPAGDFGSSDSPWIAYVLGLSTDDGSSMAALDVTLRGTFHQQWSLSEETGLFGSTPTGASTTNSDSHLMPIGSAIVFDALREDSSAPGGNAIVAPLPGTSSQQNGVGSTLGGAWGIPRADQTSSLSFAYVVVPRNADLAQYQFDISVATRSDEVFAGYTMQGCSFFSAGCNFSLLAPVVPPPVVPTVVVPPVDPTPPIVEVPTVPAPSDPVPVTPPAIEPPIVIPPITETPGVEPPASEPTIGESPWLDPDGSVKFILVEWPVVGVDLTYDLEHWRFLNYAAEWLDGSVGVPRVTAFSDGSYNNNYYAFAGDNSPIALTQSALSMNTGQSVDASLPTPEPTTALLAAIAFVSSLGVTRRRRS